MVELKLSSRFYLVAKSGLLSRRVDFDTDWDDWILDQTSSHLMTSHPDVVLVIETTTENKENMLLNLKFYALHIRDLSMYHKNVLIFYFYVQITFSFIYKYLRLSQFSLYLHMYYTKYTKKILILNLFQPVFLKVTFSYVIFNAFNGKPGYTKNVLG